MAEVEASRANSITISVIPYAKARRQGRGHRTARPGLPKRLTFPALGDLRFLVYGGEPALESLLRLSSQRLLWRLGHPAQEKLGRAGLMELHTERGERLLVALDNAGNLVVEFEILAGELAGELSSTSAPKVSGSERSSTRYLFGPSRAGSRRLPRTP